MLWFILINFQICLFFLFTDSHLILLIRNKRNPSCYFCIITIFQIIIICHLITHNEIANFYDLMAFRIYIQWICLPFLNVLKFSLQFQFLRKFRQILVISCNKLHFDFIFGSFIFCNQIYSIIQTIPYIRLFQENVAAV